MIREYPFTLPKGWLDTNGNLHQQGIMRLATGADEFFVQRHPKTMQNPHYGALVLLSRVITQLGSHTEVKPEMLEGLFIIDSVFLQQLYNRINRDASEERDRSGE